MDPINPHLLSNCEPILELLYPTVKSDEIRDELFLFIQEQIHYIEPAAGVFTCGSRPLKVYLPNGDIDVGVIVPVRRSMHFVESLYGHLLSLAANPIPGTPTVTSVTMVKAEVKLVKCVVDDIPVDITCNTLSGLSALCFFEKLDQIIGHDHLFKKSILLAKTWLANEAHLLASNQFLLSSYAVEVLVLFTINFFHFDFSYANVPHPPHEYSIPFSQLHPSLFSTSGNWGKPDGSSSTSSSTPLDSVAITANNADSSQNGKHNGSGANSGANHSSNQPLRLPQLTSLSSISTPKRQTSSQITSQCVLLTPLTVLYRLLHIFSHFDWNRYVITLAGVLPLQYLLTTGVTTTPTALKTHCYMSKSTLNNPNLPLLDWFPIHYPLPPPSKMISPSTTTMNAPVAGAPAPATSDATSSSSSQPQQQQPQPLLPLATIQNIIFDCCFVPLPPLASYVPQHSSIGGGASHGSQMGAGDDTSSSRQGGNAKGNPSASSSQQQTGGGAVDGPTGKKANLLDDFPVLSSSSSQRVSQQQQAQQQQQAATVLYLPLPKSKNMYGHRPPLVIDPLESTNNVTRSISQGNVTRIADAFHYGFTQLHQIFKMISIVGQMAPRIHAVSPFTISLPSHTPLHSALSINDAYLLTCLYSSNPSEQTSSLVPSSHDISASPGMSEKSGSPASTSISEASSTSTAISGVDTIPGSGSGKEKTSKRQKRQAKLEKEKEKEREQQQQRSDGMRKGDEIEHNHKTKDLIISAPSSSIASSSPSPSAVSLSSPSPLSPLSMAASTPQPRMDPLPSLTPPTESSRASIERKANERLPASQTGSASNDLTGRNKGSKSIGINQSKPTGSHADDDFTALQLDDSVDPSALAQHPSVQQSRILSTMESATDNATDTASVSAPSTGSGSQLSPLSEQFFPASIQPSLTPLPASSLAAHTPPLDPSTATTTTTTTTTAAAADTKKHTDTDISNNKNNNETLASQLTYFKNLTSFHENTHHRDGQISPFMSSFLFIRHSIYTFFFHTTRKYITIPLIIRLLSLVPPPLQSTLLNLCSYNDDEQSESTLSIALSKTHRHLAGLYNSNTSTLEGLMANSISTTSTGEPVTLYDRYQQRLQEKLRAAASMRLQSASMHEGPMGEPSSHPQTMAPGQDTVGRGSVSVAGNQSMGGASNMKAADPAGRGTSASSAHRRASSSVDPTGGDAIHPSDQGNIDPDLQFSEQPHILPNPRAVGGAATPIYDHRLSASSSVLSEFDMNINVDSPMLSSTASTSSSNSINHETNEKNGGGSQVDSRSSTQQPNTNTVDTAKTASEHGDSKSIYAQSLPQQKQQLPLDSVDRQPALSQALHSDNQAHGHGKDGDYEKNGNTATTHRHNDQQHPNFNNPIYSHPVLQSSVNRLLDIVHSPCGPFQSTSTSSTTALAAAATSTAGRPLINPCINFEAIHPDLDDYHEQEQRNQTDKESRPSSPLSSSSSSLTSDHEDDSIELSTTDLIQQLDIHLILSHRQEKTNAHEQLQTVSPSSKQAGDSNTRSHHPHDDQPDSDVLIETQMFPWLSPEEAQDLKLARDSSAQYYNEHFPQDPIDPPYNWHETDLNACVQRLSMMQSLLFSPYTSGTQSGYGGSQHGSSYGGGGGGNSSAYGNQSATGSGSGAYSSQTSLARSSSTASRKQQHQQHHGSSLPNNSSASLPTLPTGHGGNHQHGYAIGVGGDHHHHHHHQHHPPYDPSQPHVQIPQPAGGDHKSRGGGIDVSATYASHVSSNNGYGSNASGNIGLHYEKKRKQKKR